MTLFPTEKQQWFRVKLARVIWSSNKGLFSLSSTQPLTVLLLSNPTQTSLNTHFQHSTCYSPQHLGLRTSSREIKGYNSHKFWDFLWRRDLHHFCSCSRPVSNISCTLTQGSHTCHLKLPKISQSSEWFQGKSAAGRESTSFFLPFF